LFEEVEADPLEKEPQSFKKHHLPPQILIKSLIKKGLTTTNSFLTRPKTAQSSFKQGRDNRPSLQRLGSTEMHHEYKSTSKNRYGITPDISNDVDFNDTLEKFKEFDRIVGHATWERKQEAERKKNKL
jgi:hypothetical protein